MIDVLLIVSYWHEGQNNMAQVRAYKKDLLKKVTKRRSHMQKNYDDPFYNPVNIKRLHQELRDIESGKSTFKEHHIIEEP